MLMRNPAGILIDLWEFERGPEKAAVKVAGWLSSSGREVVLDRVLAGNGVARLNHLTTRGHLQTGRLIPVLPDWDVQGGPPINVLFRPSNDGHLAFGCSSISSVRCWTRSRQKVIGAQRGRAGIEPGTAGRLRC